MVVPKRVLIAIVLFSTVSFSSVHAGLRLTELDLATGQIELTNIGDTVHSATSLDWCVPFTYGTLESGGYSFEPGESRVYDIPFSFQDADDIWFYEDRVDPGFGDVTKVITGLIWGSDQSGRGRVDEVVDETTGVWADNTDFLSTEGLLPGQTLQAIYPGTDIDQSIGWTVADSNLGVFVPEPSAFILLLIGAFGMWRRLQGTA